MNEIDFDAAFRALTGNAPFPWQRDLYENWFSRGKFPDACTLPTGLGKTSVIAVWLTALANGKPVPRRLVYVVNRRTVVDQTTDEVENYAKPLAYNRPPLLPILLELSAKLRGITSDPKARPLALSTLRGQYADNREWSADPSCPAVICGTVDMIGSRLLFSGYGCGFKSRPLHAGFLGQDVLLVHDEAHLEPAFQDLIVAIRDEQQRCKEFRPFHVMALTATSRGGERVFELTTEEKNPPLEIPDPPEEPIHHIWRRLRAKKGLHLRLAKRDDVAKVIGQQARRWKPAGKAVLVFVRTIDDVKTVHQVLTDKKDGVPADQVQVLTGTLRGLERDKLAKEDPVFARFLPEPKVAPKPGTVYLICTSAGEVGADLSADHMACDLTTLDSMAQRLGRVNRRGGGAAEVDVVFETDPDPKKKDVSFEKARWATKTILERLPACEWADGRREGSPLALRNLSLTDEEREAAFAPEPVILPTSDILFDAWALTTIRGKLPGRPMVEPYLHGVSGWELAETHVAWREEVGEIIGDLRETFDPEDLLEAYPLKPHELLRDNSSRVFDRLKKLDANADTPVWLVADDNTVTVTKLGDLIGAGKESLSYKTVLLPPSAGGLENGMLTAGSDTANDVADEWYEDRDRTLKRRVRVWDDDEQFDGKTNGMRLVRRIDFPAADEDDVGRSWHWFELPKSGDTDGSKSNAKPVLWQVHTDDVTKNATDYVAKLPLPDDWKSAIVIAARFHDLGKRRQLFQRVLNNFRFPERVLAKSGKKGGRVAETYRHEFGSLLDVQAESDFQKLTNDLKNVVLHLIATHHGRGRPHFPANEAFDPEPNGRDAAALAAEVPRRYARLQRKYGRWGLAYLESLLRAADYAASARPSKCEEEGS